MDTDVFEFTGGGVLREDMMPDYFAHWQGVGRIDERQPEWQATFDVFVYESWYPRRDAQGKMDWIEGSPLMPVQQIGALRWIARKSGARIVTQHPNDKPMAVATMPKEFKALNRDSNEQHDQDARMHLWLYFWRNWFTGAVPPGKAVRGV